MHSHPLLPSANLNGNRGTYFILECSASPFINDSYSIQEPVISFVNRSLSTQWHLHLTVYEHTRAVVQLLLERSPSSIGSSLSPEGFAFQTNRGACLFVAKHLLSAP